MFSIGQASYISVVKDMFLGQFHLCCKMWLLRFLVYVFDRPGQFHLCWEVRLLCVLIYVLDQFHVYCKVRLYVSWHMFSVRPVSFLL